MLIVKRLYIIHTVLIAYNCDTRANVQRRPVLPVMIGAVSPMGTKPA